MAPKVPKPPFPPAAAATVPNKPPRQKHGGLLGDTMRKAHNTKRMDAVRSKKGK